MKNPVLLFSILLPTLLFSSFLGSAQYKIQGTVLDQEGTAIPFAKVTLQQIKGKQTETHQTDSSGYFNFKKEKNEHFHLSIYAFGYKRVVQELYLQTDTSLSIILQPLSKNLKGITITEKKLQIQRKADRVIFNVQQNVNTAGSNGLNLLRQVPGLQVSNQRVSLAGKGDMGIMVDGRILHLSDKALVNYLRSFSSNSIKKIEVITHPGANYEAEGNAGLINIVTQKSKKAGWSGTLSGAVKGFFYKNQPDYKGIKNYGDYDGSLNLNYNKNNWSFYANADYTAGRELWGYGIGVHYPDQFWDMGDTGEYRIATFNVLAGADYRLNKYTTIGASYNYTFHLEDGADYVNVPIYNAKGLLDSSLKTFATYYPVAKGNAFNLHLKQQLNPSGAQMTLNADYFNFFRTDWSNLITRGYDNKGNLQPGSTQKLYDTTLQNIKIYTFKADFVYPTSFAKLTFGGKLSFINNYSNIFYFHKDNHPLQLDSSLSNEFRYIENTQALYFNASRKLKKWNLAAGLRAELTQTKAISYFERSTIKQKRLRFFPSLMANYSPNENHHFSLTYNRRIHRPTFWNLNPYKSFMTAYTYVEGNPYLEPEYITNIQLAHQYKKKWNSSLYMKIIDNGFAQVIVPQENGKYDHITRMLNFIKGYRYGISESLTLHPISWWETHNLLTAYHTTIQSNKNYISGMNNWGGYVETNNTFYLNEDKTFSGYFGFWYQFPEIDHFGRSNSYYNVDLGLQMTTLQKRLTVSLNYSDIFQSSASTITSIVKDFKTTYTNFQLNSQIKLSAEWHFGQENLKKNKTSSGNKEERNRLN